MSPAEMFDPQTLAAGRKLLAGRVAHGRAMEILGAKASTATAEEYMAALEAAAQELAAEGLDVDAELRGGNPSHAPTSNGRARSVANPPERVKTIDLAACTPAEYERLTGH